MRLTPFFSLNLENDMGTVILMTWRGGGAYISEYGKAITSSASVTCHSFCACPDHPQKQQQETDTKRFIVRDLWAKGQEILAWIGKSKEDP